MMRAASLSREVGTALAVLAIYVLTLLAPLHQARATQLTLNELGYSAPITGWDICTGQGLAGDTPSSIAKCPATMAGKGAPLPVADLGDAHAAPFAPFLPAKRPATLPPADAWHYPLGSRAPPVLS
jgi:hypothetical protein